MKKILFISLMYCGCVIGQEEKKPYNPEMSLKIQSRLNVNLEVGSIITLTGIIPAVQFKTSRDYLHQIEVSGLSLGNSSFRNRDLRSFYLAAGYEFSIPLDVFVNNERLSPYLGLGLSTFANTSFFNPSDPRQFKQSSSIYVANLYVLPSLRKHLNDRLFLDFALLIYLGEVDITSIRSEDPAIPIGNQRQTTTGRTFFAFEQFASRFGFGVKL
jgi:hypothetical protein